MKHRLILLVFVCINRVAFTQPTSFSSRGVGGGGAMFAMSINPSNDDEYYAACDMFDLFHTTNFGLSYNQVPSSQLISSEKSKVCYTSTSGLLYSIGLPTNFFPVPVKSIDNGLTWTALAGNPAPNNYDRIFATYSINTDYNNPNRIIISNHDTVYFSSNWGNSFTNILSASNTTAGIIVGGVFFDNNTIYIGTNNGVFISTNGGTSWTIAALTGIPPTERIWEFTGAKVGAATRFFCITANENDISVDLEMYNNVNFAKGVYSADYGTGNWVPKMNGININADYLMHIDMAQNDINTVYIAASDSYPLPLMFKTTDGGANWTNVLHTAGNQNVITGWCGQNGTTGWGGCGRPFGFDVAPNNSNKVIFGGWGQIHKTADGGNMWQQAYTDAADQTPANIPTPTGTSFHSIGFENTSCWQVHWMNQNSMWTCFTDMFGIRSTDAGSSWSFANNSASTDGGETYRVVQHPVNGILFAARARIHDIYQPTYIEDWKLDTPDAEGKIIYSTDNGLNWQVLKLFNHPVFWIALDPNNPNRAYASVVNYGSSVGSIGGIYMTNDLQNLTTASWTLLPNPQRTEKHPASIVVLNDGKMVCSYSARVDYSGPNGGTYSASSGVFIYNPSSNTWVDVSDAGMYYYTKDIVVDPNDAAQNTWYAGVFSAGWSINPANNLGGLYKTTNRGAAWTKILSDKNIESCTFNPNNADELYVTTTSEGLWVSSNINSAAPTFSQAAAYNFWHPIRIFFNPYNSNEMWVTSFGNGMKVGNLLSLSVNENELEANSFSIYPNPSANNITLGLNNIYENQPIQIFNSRGELVKEVSKKNNETVNISDLPSGLYFIRLKNIPSQVKKFIKQK